eukprot:s303_g33.t2
MDERDLLISEGHDLSDETVWQELAEKIASGYYDVILMSPPCSTWSRALWANRHGPNPVRSRDFPYGFPWLVGAAKEKAELGTVLVMRCIEVLKIAPPRTTCMWEHPEDLGRARNGTPASVWQLAELRQAAKSRQMHTVAIHQCAYGADYPKPTRLLSDANGLLQVGFPGWPMLNKELYYLGPLPRSCGHNHDPLIGTNDSGQFKTAPTAAYPPRMNEMIATLVFNHWDRLPSTSAGGGKELQNARPSSSSSSSHRPAAGAGVEQLPAGGDHRQEDPSLDLKGPSIDLESSGGHQGLRTAGGKPFHDGSGLCSQGNRRPAFRRQEEAMLRLGEDMLALTTEEELRSDLYRLALGRCNGPPFRSEVIQRAKEMWLGRLGKLVGKPPRDLEVVEERQPFMLAALEAHLRAVGDPDAGAFSEKPGCFRKGVPIGVDEPLPRVPAVFEEKEKWKKYEAIPFPQNKENYLSARDHARSIQLQFRQEELKGAMVELEEEEARRRYGGRLRVAALAALEKSDRSFRVVHDATHGVGVNDKVKVLDQLRYPGPAEIRRAMEVLHPVSFVLAADISRAHRLVLIREDDWGCQACKTGVDDLGNPSSKVWLNCVGTFGVTSASYHFTRMFGAVVRCSHSLCGRRDSFQLTYVDDLLFLARGLGGLAGIWLTLLFLVIAGTPFSWHKFGGGLKAEWIGFQVDISKKELGMTEKRLRWARDWIEKVVTNRMVRVEEFRSALGRLAFMMSAFGHLKPLLGPLYSWVTAVDHCTTLQVPAAVLMILMFLKRTLVSDVARTKVRPPEENEEDHFFRSDAKAEGELVVIGGWCCGDSPDRAKCRWFSVKLDRSTVPWAFEAGEPYKAIASLELLGTLASLVAFPLSRGKSKKFHLSAGTDNMGNRHLVSRLLTTKFPLCIILMQLAWWLHTRELELQLDWLPRLQNREADALTNGDFSGFDPSLRVEIKPDDLLEKDFKQLMDLGSELYGEVKELRRKRKEGNVRPVPASKKTRSSDLIGPW